MLKNKEKNFANLGCCKEKNHDNSKKKYICLANSCNFSELLCHFCVLNSHSNHRIISFLSFAKQTSILFSQSLNDLSSLINSFEIQEVLCNKIDDVCQNLKKLLILIEDKIYERKKNLNSKINEAKYSLQKIICFNDKYFDNIFSANKDNNDLIKDDKNSNLIEKIIEIKNELLIEGNSCFKLRSFESLSSFYSGSFNESLMDQVYLSLKECTFALGAIIFPNIQIPENPQSITAFVSFYNYLMFRSGFFYSNWSNCIVLS